MTRVSACLTERVSLTGFSVTPARRLPPAPAMNNTEASAGSQFSPMRSTTATSGAGMGCLIGRSCSSSTKNAASSPVVETMKSRRPGRATLGSMRSMMVSGSVMSVPPQPVPGSATWK